MTALADAIDPGCRALVLVAAYCGLRAGELAAFRWRRVDMLRRGLRVEELLDRQPGGVMTFRPPKSKAGRRSVPMPQLVVDALAVHAQAGYSDLPTAWCSLRRAARRSRWRT